MLPFFQMLLTSGLISLSLGINQVQKQFPHLSFGKRVAYAASAAAAFSAAVHLADVAYIAYRWKKDIICLSDLSSQDAIEHIKKAKDQKKQVLFFVNSNDNKEYLAIGSAVPVTLLAMDRKAQGLPAYSRGEEEAQLLLAASAADAYVVIKEIEQAIPSPEIFAQIASNGCCISLTSLPQELRSTAWQLALHQADGKEVRVLPYKEEIYLLWGTALDQLDALDPKGQRKLGIPLAYEENGTFNLPAWLMGYLLSEQYLPLAAQQS